MQVHFPAFHTNYNVFHHKLAHFLPYNNCLGRSVVSFWPWCSEVKKARKVAIMVRFLPVGWYANGLMGNRYFMQTLSCNAFCFVHLNCLYGLQISLVDVCIFLIATEITKRAELVSNDDLKIILETPLKSEIFFKSQNFKCSIYLRQTKLLQMFLRVRCNNSKGFYIARMLPEIGIFVFQFTNESNDCPAPTIDRFGFFFIKWPSDQFITRAFFFVEPFQYHFCCTFYLLHFFS